MTTTPAVGDILHFDFQSDDFRGQYRLIRDLGRGRFLAEYVEPSDELIDAVVNYYLNSPNPYLDFVDPFGPGRRRATRQEAADAEILRRIEYAGDTFTIEFVSAQRYAAAF